MARDTLPIQTIPSQGTPFDASISFTSIVAANGLQFDNSSGEVVIIIQNAGTSGAQTAVISSVADSYGRLLDNDDVAVAQGAVGVIGALFPASNYNTAGMAYLDSVTEDNFNFAAVRPLRK
jgi:hypothetical protein